MVRNRQRYVRILFHDDACDPGFFQAPDNPKDIVHNLWRQPLAWLIKEDETWRAEQRATDCHHLHFSAGEGLCLARQEILQRRKDLDDVVERPGLERGALLSQ